MQKYVYIRSPLKAAQLLEAGFSYMKAPFGSDNSVFIFEVNDALMQFLQRSFTLGEDYIVQDGARMNF